MERISRKITDQEYGRIKRLYWWMNTEAKMSDYDWSKTGGGADLSMDAVGMAMIRNRGEKIKNARDVAILERLLAAEIPEDFDIEQYAEKIRETGRYCLQRGGAFPLA